MLTNDKVHFHMGRAAHAHNAHTQSISKRLSISFLSARNRDLGENYPSTVSLNIYSNIAILYYEFFASQK
jgi:hypothetical protein